MLAKIKKYLPNQLKRSFTTFYQHSTGQHIKRRLFLRMQKKHQILLAKIKGKKRIRVIFLAIHKSIWKVDPVFREMLADPFFEPIILVCPYTIYGEERMWEDMRECLAYFKEKGYPTYSSYKDEDRRWIKLDELEPDIIFFTNPHDLTRREYYQDAYLNYLSCYVPYFILTTTHEGDHSIYNLLFHNSMWKIFMPHPFSMERMKVLSAGNGKNSELTGYPACEVLLKTTENKTSAWKIQKKDKKRIIFAPHHTIFEGELKLSNFLSIAEVMQLLAEKYRDEIQWAFKPHPILKTKLYAHPLWGINKTNDYYSYWESQDFTQYDNGEYSDLFKESDAIIHDCGSFIAEYLFLKKVCGYLVVNNNAQLNSINNFGKFALNAYVKLNDIKELESFIKNVKNDVLEINKEHHFFYNSYVAPFYLKNNPTKIIIEILRFNLLKED